MKTMNFLDPLIEGFEEKLEAQIRAEIEQEIIKFFKAYSEFVDAMKYIMIMGGTDEQIDKLCDDYKNEDNVDYVERVRISVKEYIKPKGFFDADFLNVHL